MDYPIKTENRPLSWAHLHLDEATPHLHIDFVPFIKTDGKRGLETRVSLKQALKAQGFVGVHKKDSEWARWIQAEKEQLAAIMERHGIEWEHKGIERPHLDVLDYKLQERQRELAELDAVVKEKTDEANILEKQIENLTESAKVITTISRNFENEPEYQLPAGQGTVLRLDLPKKRPRKILCNRRKMTV